MDPCRFGTMCWRPLCPKRARKWADVGEDEEQIVDLEEELFEVVKASPRTSWSRPSNSGLLGLERMMRPAPSLQQSDRLLVKLGLLGS